MRHGLVHAGERLGTPSLTVVAIILLNAMFHATLVRSVNWEE